MVLVVPPLVMVSVVATVSALVAAPVVTVLVLPYLRVELGEMSAAHVADERAIRVRARAHDERLLGEDHVPFLDVLLHDEARGLAARAVARHGCHDKINDARRCSPASDPTLNSMPKPYNGFQINPRIPE